MNVSNFKSISKSPQTISSSSMRLLTSPKSSNRETRSVHFFEASKSIANDTKMALKSVFWSKTKQPTPVLFVVLIRKKIHALRCLQVWDFFLKQSIAHFGFPHDCLLKNRSHRFAQSYKRSKFIFFAS